MRDKVAGTVIATIQNLGDDFDLPELKEANEETRLFGAKSGIDSIALVTLIAEVEDVLSNDFSKAVILADEKAMSQKLSPFRRVGTLIDYATSLLEEAE